MTQEQWDNVSEVQGLSTNFTGGLTATEFFGYTVDYLYHLIVMILLLNLLIAKMSQTYSDICNNADLEWKFQRTAFLRRFMDYHEFLTPPFNLIPRLNLWREVWQGLVRKKRGHNVEANVGHKLQQSLRMTPEQKKVYYLFEDVLHQRLLHRQLEKRSEVAEVLEMSKEMVQDTNSMLTKIEAWEKNDRSNLQAEQREKEYPARD